MNFLFHIFLSGNDPELLTGNFMGDFVKGQLGDRYPDGITRGLMLHRKLDSFAQRDFFFQQSRLRLSREYGLYRGVLVDLFYDHFLVATWSNWSEESFASYLARARKIVDSHLAIMPEELQKFVPVIFEELIPSYATVAGIETALHRMSRRIGRANPLSGGAQELIAHYHNLQTDFCAFTPAAQKYADDFSCGSS